jgi:energy-coupling factor transporter ATP-binding protein EcfA2
MSDVTPKRDTLGRVSPLHRRELKLLVVLSFGMVLSGVGVFRMLSVSWSARPLGLTAHLFYGTLGTLGVGVDTALAFCSFTVLGLFLLTALDEYKQVHGVLLLVATAVGSVILFERGVFVTAIDWGSEIPSMVAGLATGLVVGGLERDGFGLTHDVFQNGRTTGRFEFDRALSRVFLVVSVIVVVGLIEQLFVYESPLVYAAGEFRRQPATLHRVALADSLGSAVSAAVFLGTIYVFRSNTKQKDIVLLGATGAGKSTLMAGLNYAAPEYTSGRTATDDNEPLWVLTNRLREYGFAGFPSTPNGQAFPMAFTYKHGFLFPRKVTVRTLDYAGDHLQGFTPRTDASETATASMDEAFAVAEFLLNNAESVETTGERRADGGAEAETAGERTATGERATGERAGTGGDGFAAIEWYGDSATVGTNPKEIDTLADCDTDSAVVREIVRDMAFYADSIGLLYPLEDYADTTVQNGTHKPYVSLDRRGRIVPTRDRSADYEQVFRRIDEAYRADKRLFCVATFADLVTDDFAVNGPAGVDHEDRWDLFGEYVRREFLTGRLPSDTAYDPIPVYFPITSESPPGPGEELEIDLDAPGDRLPLRGASELLDRMGE